MDFSKHADYMNTEQPSTMPQWAKRTNEYGKNHLKCEKSSGKRKGEYVGAIIFNFIGLYIVTHVMDWDLKFIKDNFPVIVWALVLNIWIQIGGNAIMLIFDIRIVRHLARIVLEAANFLTLIIVYTFFPFDFTVYPGLHFLEWLVPIMLIIGMIVSALKVLSNLWKLIFWRD
jgi:hypothetical protein